MRPPHRTRRKTPAENIRFGEQGVLPVRYLGQMPRDFRGAVTGTLYAYSERHPVKMVDKRDLPQMTKETGRKDLVDDREWHKERVKQRTEPEPEPEPERDAEEPEEVTEDGQMVDDG